MEDHFDPAAANVVSISYQTVVEAGRPVLRRVLAQSSGFKRPVYVPSVPVLIDSFLDQQRYRQTQNEATSDIEKYWFSDFW